MILEFMRLSHSLNRKIPSNLLEYRILWDTCNEFSLRESDFCTVSEPKAAALWQFQHVVSWLQQVPQVHTVKISILITYQALGWIWVFLLPALVCVCRPGTVQPNSCLFLWSSICCAELHHSSNDRKWSARAILQFFVCPEFSMWHVCEIGLRFRLDFAMKNCEDGWLQSLQMGWKAANTGFFWGAGGWIYLAWTYFNISSEMENQNVF